MVDKDPASRRRRGISSIAQAYRDSQEVMSAALAVALLAGGGYWLDMIFGWKPVLTIAGLLIGCLMAAASLRQLLIRLEKRSKDRQKSMSSKRSSEE